MNHLDAILEYKSAISQLDYSIAYEFYENDLIFIIAIDNDKYEQFEKEINHISFEIHSKFDLNKEIVCMPKDFVSDWDIPILLNKEIVCMPKDFVSDWDIPILLMDSKFENRFDCNKNGIKARSDFSQDLLYTNIKSIIDYNCFKIYESSNQIQGVSNGCKAA